MTLEDQIESLQARLVFAMADNARLVAANAKLGIDIPRLAAERDELLRDGGELVEMLKARCAELTSELNAARCTCELGE